MLRKLVVTDKNRFQLTFLAFLGAALFLAALLVVLDLDLDLEAALVFLAAAFLALAIL